MSQPFEEMADLDRFVHEPARLAILTALSVCAAADFVYLRRLTGLSGGNLNGHIGRLADAGLVEISKAFVDKTPRTVVSLTDTGRERVDRHWAELDRLRRAARRWRPS